MKQPALFAVALMLVSGLANADTPKKASGKAPPKPPVKSQNVTKGQGQQQGGDGVFKTIYTLNSGFNFTILSARFSVDPYDSYETEYPNTDEKLLILSVAIKNANPQDAFFNGDTATFTAVDDKGQNHSGQNYRLNSLNIKGFSPTVKPGQGYGQDPAQDELTVAVKVPANAKITKIILNSGRKFVPGEEVVRYFVAGAATKERDGAVGNPKNVIAPLPDYVRDPADASGATGLVEGKAKADQFVPTGLYNVRFDGLTTSTTEKLNDTAPEEGKQYAIATFTVKNTTQKELVLFDLVSDEEIPVLKDADGEKYHVVSGSGVRKAKRDEQADTSTKLAPGETYSFRSIFAIPKDAKPKSIVFGQTGGHHYIVDIAPK